MATKRTVMKALLRELSRSSERSSLFWWMVENHDLLAGAAGGKRIRWKPTCAYLEQLGLRDADGNPPTERTARETWSRARAEVKRLRQQTVQAQAAMFPTLRPIPVQPRPQPQPVRTSSPPIAASHSRQPEAKQDGNDWETQLAGLQNTIHQRSRV